MPLIHELYRVTWEANQVEYEDFVFAISREGIRTYVAQEKRGHVTGIHKATRDEALLEFSKRIRDLKDMISEKNEALLTAREAVEEAMEKHGCKYGGVIREIDYARELPSETFFG